MITNKPPPPMAMVGPPIRRRSSTFSLSSRPCQRMRIFPREVFSPGFANARVYCQRHIDDASADDASAGTRPQKDRAAAIMAL